MYCFKILKNVLILDALPRLILIENFFFFRKIVVSKVLEVYINILNFQILSSHFEMHVSIILTLTATLHSRDRL